MNTPFVPQPNQGMGYKKILGIPYARTVQYQGEPQPPQATSTPPQQGEFTMYNPVANQTKPSSTTMASGKTPYDGAIATGDRTIPFGTLVHVPELNKTFTVEDRMNQRYQPDQYGKQVFDVLNSGTTTDAISKALQFGRQQLHYVIIGHDGRKK